MAFVVGGSHELRNSFVVISVTVVVITVVALLRKFLWRPMKMRRLMIKQGVAAAPFRIIFGNLADCYAYAAKFPEDLHVDGHYDSTPTVSPMFTLYFPKNGNSFVYEWGSDTRLVSRDPEFAREVLSTKYASFGKAAMNKFVLGEVAGRASVSVLDDERHDAYRRVLNPFFFPEPLKAMVNSMVEGAVSVIQTWEEKVTQGGGVADFDVLADVRLISGKIISLTAFSSDFEKGRQIHENQSKLVDLLFKSLTNPVFWIPGYRLLPTKPNRERARLKKENRSLLEDIIGNRKKAVANGTKKSYGDDLLGHMLLAAEGSKDFTLESVFPNAENFYFASQESVSNSIAYALLMLARHPDWQDRARKEVTEVCGSCNGAMDVGMLNRLKTVGMIINETLRLFVVLPRICREAKEDVQIGDLFIPKGMVIEIGVQAMHLDAALWGDDVFQFNPERFANGASNACTHPLAFLPFSLGSYFCIGNNFATMQLKVVLATVLQRFQIFVSPSYKHHPYFNLVQKPKYGMQLVLKTL